MGWPIPCLFCSSRIFSALHTKIIMKVHGVNYVGLPIVRVTATKAKLHLRVDLAAILMTRVFSSLVFVVHKTSFYSNFVVEDW